MKVLNWFRLTRKSEVDRIKKYNEDLTNLFSKEQKRSVKLATEVDHLKAEIKSIPFEFDNLLLEYNEAQLNCLYYKLINYCRNNNKYKHLLTPWNKRLSNAVNVPKS
jgi:hypothetical protein